MGILTINNLISLIINAPKDTKIVSYTNTGELSDNINVEFVDDLNGSKLMIEGVTKQEN